MVKEYSPFTPGVPVDLKLFVGREAEIGHINKAVGKSVHKKSVERLFIFGERGIGKSSICNAGLKIAERDHNVLGLHVYLGGVTTMEELVRRIFERLLQVSSEKPWFEKIKGFFGDHIRAVGLLGLTVEFSASEKDLSRAVNDFAPAIRHLLKTLGDEKKGIFLILDDLNGLAESKDFANWLKSMVDEIATSSEPLPLTLALVGLPERRAQLISSQPSLDRVFDLIEIKRLNEKETFSFFERSFQSVNVEASEKALAELFFYSEGYPVFLHELGDAVFNKDTDGRIDEADVMKGIIEVIKIVDQKYLDPKVYSAIRSEKYLNILKADIPFSFTRQQLKTLLPGESGNVDNFLRAMEKLNVVHKDNTKGQGSYVFSSFLIFIAIRLGRSLTKSK